MPSVLVTGGAGFIGSHVVRSFLEQGFAVDVLDDLSRGSRERVPARIPFHELDVRSAAAAALVRSSGFDIICHLAARDDVRRSVADPLGDLSVNVAGTVNLLEAVRLSGAPTRFVFSSTAGDVYGDEGPFPTPEFADKRPASPVGTTKLAAEQYVRCYGRVHGVSGVVLRYASVFGPGQDGHGEAGVVSTFCGRLLDGEPLLVFGDGRQTRDHVFVGDVARANLLAARAELPPAQLRDGRTYNIGTGAETSVLELIRELETITGLAANVRYAPARPGERRRSLLSCERARRQLGWAPERSLRHNLETTVRAFVEKRSARQPRATRVGQWPAAAREHPMSVAS